MEQPTLGTVVHYVTATPQGNYPLPARIFAFNGTEAQMRVYTDQSGSSEWVVSAEYDEAKSAGTWHYRDVA